MSQVGENMIYRFIEGKECYIKNCGKMIEIGIDEISCLEEPSKLFERIMLNDKLFKLIKFPDEVLSVVIDVVINGKDINYLKKELTDQSVYFYSLIINVVNNYTRKYQDFKLLDESNEIIIVCTKDNFIKVLDLSKKINKKINIDGQSIPLSDYKNMLDNYDIKSLDDVKIQYQEQNSPIPVDKLYELSLLIDNIIENIKKYNLSPLEKLIYTYDIVKYREYKESDCNKKNSRDLDKVLQGDAIVCVGYSNLFNAILRCMGFNATYLISVEKKHQRSMVYIRDDKYNIDGIYAFDPTFDRRKNENYIDNYKYFAMTMEKSEKDNPSTHKLKPWSTLDELISLYENDDAQHFKEGLNKLNELEDLFNFVHEEGASKVISIIEDFSYSRYESKDNARNAYAKIMKKYKPEEISASIFMKALLRTRIIECYTGVISDFDVDDVIEASTTRTVFQKTNYQDYQNAILKMFDMIDYNSEVYEILDRESSTIKDDIENNKLKVRLLKVLRNGRK